MASAHARDEGDFFPFTNVTLPSKEELPPSSSERNVTPRGYIFPSLNEAHRKITQKLGSAGAALSRMTSAERVSAESQVSAKDIPLQDFNAVRTHSQEAPDTGNTAATLRQYPAERLSRHKSSSRAMLGRSLTDRRNLARPQDSPSTIGIIDGHHEEHESVEHYGEQGSDQFSSSRGSSGHPYAHSFPQPHNSSPYDSQAAAAFLLGQGERDMRPISQAHYSVQEERASTYETLTGETKAEAHASLRMSSNPSPQHLRLASQPIPHATKGMVPSPLRILSRTQRQNGRRLENFSSENGDSTDSHEEPFVYDQYLNFPQPLKERDVSCALGRISTFATGEETQPILSRSASGCVPEQDSRTFHTMEDDEGNVRVRINHRTEHTEATDKGTANNNGLQVPTKGRSGKLNRERTSASDWVTEATSEVGFGNAHGIKPTGSSIADYSDDGFGTRQQMWSSRDHILRHPSVESNPINYKIRDIKDRGAPKPVLLPKNPGARLNGFAQDSLRLRSDLPKASNGSETSRKLTNPFRRGSHKRADSSSFFVNKRGPHRFDFRDSTSTCGGGAVIDSNRTIHGTYDTIHSESMASVDTEEVLNVEESPAANYISHQNFDYTVGEDMLPTPRPALTRDYAIDAPLFDSSPSYNPFSDRRMMSADGMSSPFSPGFMSDGLSTGGSKFSFPLLDLPYAQKLQKMKRASGEDDEIETGHSRYKRFMSKTSSGRPSTHRPSTSPTPLLSSVRRYPARRGSQLSSGFILPSSTGSRSSRAPDSPIPEPAPVLPNPRRQGRMADMRHPAWPGRQPDTEQGYRISDGHEITTKAHGRRKLWFYAMMLLGIFPFFGLIVKTRPFNDTLLWLTRGEVNQLSRRQKKTLTYMCCATMVVYAATVAGLIVFFVMKDSTGS